MIAEGTGFLRERGPCDQGRRRHAENREQPPPRHASSSGERPRRWSDLKAWKGLRTVPPDLEIVSERNGADRPSPKSIVH